MDTAANDPHRPTVLEQMVGAAVWTRLRETMDAGQHVIVAGKPGCGKSAALRLLLNNDISGGRHIGLWYPCSADPSLRDGRDRIKAVARRRGVGIATNWIVLEHAELLHADAQAFLRRVNHRLPIERKAEA